MLSQSKRLLAEANCGPGANSGRSYVSLREGTEPALATSLTAALEINQTSREARGDERRELAGKVAELRAAGASAARAASLIFAPCLMPARMREGARSCSREATGAAVSARTEPRRPRHRSASRMPADARERLGRREERAGGEPARG
ncbi:hypothetical protein SRHO_G00285100 [Serrasalmus rhombeus]